MQYPCNAIASCPQPPCHVSTPPRVPASGPSRINTRLRPPFARRHLDHLQRGARRAGFRILPFRNSLHSVAASVAAHFGPCIIPAAVPRTTPRLARAPSDWAADASLVAHVSPPHIGREDVAAAEYAHPPLREAAVEQEVGGERRALCHTATALGALLQYSD